MSAGAVDVRAVLERMASQAESHRETTSLSYPALQRVYEEDRAAIAAVANLIAERDALHWALVAYPKQNTHQLQAQKVCDGVVSLAVARVGGSK